jgi:DNA-binding beta-propeller fold protein YncE
MSGTREARASRTAVALSLLLVVARPASAEDTPALREVGHIELPGPAGKRFDYLTIDYEDGWIFSAHLGANQTYVIDRTTQKVLHTIADTPRVEGVTYVPELRKLYTSHAGDGTVGVVDLTTMRVVNRIPSGAKPDGSTYAAPHHKLYVTNERAKTEAVIDIREDRVVATLSFESETGVPIYDPKADLVYVNLQDQNAIAVIDPATDHVRATHAVEGCQGNHGMALDVEGRRAFLACEGNDTLAVFDVDAHRVVARLPLAAGADVVQFDPGLRRVYVACSSGAIAVFQQDSPDRVRALGNVPVQRRVHSLAVDVETHRVYAPEQEHDGRPVARMIVFEPR